MKEHLTAQNNHIFYLARHARRYHIFYHVWTDNGRVWATITENSNPILLNNPTEIENSINEAIKNGIQPDNGPPPPRQRDAQRKSNNTRPTHYYSEAVKSADSRFGGQSRSQPDREEHRGPGWGFNSNNKQGPGFGPQGDSIGARLRGQTRFGFAQQDDQYGKIQGGGTQLSTKAAPWF